MQDPSGGLSFSRAAPWRARTLLWLWCLAMLTALAGVAAVGYRKHLIDELRRPVLSQFGDPGSVRFRHERLVSDWTRDGSILCGQVDAPAFSDGIPGFRNFVALPDRAKIDSRPVPPGGSRGETENCPYQDTARWWHLRW